jgi:hypothetical protein
VAWSYDLLDDAEKVLLDRCSVFAGGFDLESACAVAGSDQDEFEVLNLLDALVRKSLVVADRSSGHARFSMLETIRQFAEEQLVARGEASEIRAAHAHYFAGREADIMALWDSPRQREAYAWLPVELANLRTAFRWAADHGDLDVAATIATYATILGNPAGNYEAIAWAEELIEPAHAVDHPRLAALYEMASHCYFVGRIEAAVRYSDAGQTILCSGRDYALPFGGEGVLVGPYLAIGQPERVIEWCRAQLALGRNTLTQTQTMLVMALTTAGSVDEARIAAEGLIDAAEATRNPYVLSLALAAYGFAIRNTDPARARAALRRGMVIAHESGNSFTEATLAVALSTLEAAYGDTLDALDHISAAIRTWFDAGNTATIRSPLAVLTALLDRLGRYEPAAVIAGFAVDPLTAQLLEITTAIAHLRDVLGVATYESLARKGETMTTAAMATYAYDQIDQARTELEHPS